jgi:carboxymethylenebutenolidase
VPDERLVGDVGGAANYLRGLACSNGKIGVIGYCSGGRQSVLAACNLDLDAAVDCYGAFVVGDPPEGFPLPGHKPRRSASEPPRTTARAIRRGRLASQSRAGRRTDEILTAYDKPHGFHSYEDAGHAFFSVDRPA